MFVTSTLPLLLLAVATTNAAPSPINDAKGVVKRQTYAGYCNPSSNTCTLTDGAIYGCNNGYNCLVNDGACFYLDGVVLCGT